MKKYRLLSIALLLFFTARSQADTIGVSYHPVMLFEVQAVDQVIMLKWAVEGSEGFKSFDIERSDDGTNFFKVGSKLAISKNRNGGYDFVDATPKKNTLLHYRLKLLDQGGNAVYTLNRQIKPTGKQWSVGLRQNPIPVNLELVLSANRQLTDPAVVTILANSGQVLQTQAFRLATGKNFLLLPLQAIAPGLYQAVIEVGHERETIPFIKE